MNKRLYRTVFNKARGMLMVVSELARGCSGGSSSSGIGHALQRLVCRVGALSLALWLASGAVTVQAAGIVADASAPGKQQPTVISTANGTTQVNIQTPSAGGVSRNTYSQFDVGRDGAESGLVGVLALWDGAPGIGCTQRRRHSDLPFGFVIKGLVNNGVD